MALRTSDPDRPIRLADFAADIERRRQVADVTDVPRNAGRRRTENKRALLAAIEALGGRW